MAQIVHAILQESCNNWTILLIASVLMAEAWWLLIRSKRYLLAMIMLALSLAVLDLSEGLKLWISGLGGDSFLEGSLFNGEEALAWLRIFATSLPQMAANPKVVILTVTETVLLSVFLMLAMCIAKCIRWILIIFLLVGIGNAGMLCFRSYVEGQKHIRSLKTEFNQYPKGFSTSQHLDLLVYIGESTSTLNMSLYGYPLPTTPQLDAIAHSDIGFVFLQNVYSTHTHTSESLLRALSIRTANDSNKQYGIGSVLQAAGVHAALLSVQPLSGSFAAFSRFVFDGTEIHREAADKYKSDLAQPHVKDHVLLEEALKRRNVVFFHSYAGHVTYKDHIDLSLSREIDEPRIGIRGTFGKAFSPLLNQNAAADVADYDRAITYIDRNVAHAIENIRERQQPAVLIYFSDHGESVYAHRGHESSNFINEMATVPMILYFNKAYREHFPEVFANYKTMATDRHIKLLDQVAPTILDVLRIESKSKLRAPTLASRTAHPHPWIMERSTLSGDSRIDVRAIPERKSAADQFSGGTITPTYISILNSIYGNTHTLCYHRADSYAKALRAAAVSNCMEFDLMVEGGKMNVRHPPAPATEFTIEHIFSIAEMRKTRLWIDAKNLDDPAACNQLADYLEKNWQRTGQVMVEFPSSAASILEQLSGCSKRMRRYGIKTSFYMPSELLLSCARDVSGKSTECNQLDQVEKKVAASSLFSDLSFEFDGYAAMQRFKQTQRLKWDTWVIPAQDYGRFPRDAFDFVILDTWSDPNTY